MSEFQVSQPITTVNGVDDLTSPARAIARRRTNKPAEVEKSAREFESILVTQWLQQAQEAFASVPGSDREHKEVGHDQFQSIALTALSSTICGTKHGLGISSMIVKYLTSSGTEPEK